MTYKDEADRQKWHKIHKELIKKSNDVKVVIGRGITI